MFRTFTLVLLVAISTTTANAQIPIDEQGYADSILRVAGNTSKGDSVRASAYLQLSGYWSDLDMKRAMDYFSRGKKLARKFPYLVAVSHFYEAGIYQKKYPEKSEALYLQGDRLLEKYHDRKSWILRSKLWLNYSILLQQKDKQEQIIRIILQKAIPYAKIAGDSTLLAYHYADLATELSNNEEYDKAELYFKQAIEKLEKHPRTTDRLISAYLGAAYNYSLNSKQNSAAIMLSKAKRILKNHPRSSLYPDLYSVEIDVLCAQGKHLQALEKIEPGILRSRQAGQYDMVSSFLYQKFEILKQLKRYAEAEQVFHILYTDKEFNSYAKQRLDLLRCGADISFHRGKLRQAYQLLEESVTLSDSIGKMALRKSVNDLEIKYRYKENEHKINTLNAEKQEMAYRADRSRLMNWLLGTASVLLFVIIILLVLYFRNNKRLNQEMKNNHQQQLQVFDQQKRLEITRAFIEGEEHERERLSRDLHDGVGGLLAATKMQMAHMCTKESNKDLLFERATASLDLVMNELRKVSRNLMPGTLNQFGLNKTLQDLCATLRSSKTDIDYQWLGDDAQLEKKTELTIYRIIQELLSNAIRHSDASYILLQCSRNRDHFFITVEDNGVGFSPMTQESSKGMGIENIRNRVSWLKGKLDIQSTPGSGTIINIELNVS